MVGFTGNRHSFKYEAGYREARLATQSQIISLSGTISTQPANSVQKKNMEK